MVCTFLLIRWMKLNFDGSMVEGGIVVEGIIHDNNYNMVVAYAGCGHMGTNNEVDALALLWGIRLARDRGMDKMMIEGDSLLIIMALKGARSDNWKIKPMIKEICTILEGF